MSLVDVQKKLHDFALTFPETIEEFPWGESAMKVKKKAFVFMRGEKDKLSFSMKLPESRDFALQFPFAAPTGYGLGKSGWVTFTFRKPSEVPDLAMIRDWMRESFRAVAPKKISALLEGAAAGVEKRPARTSVVGGTASRKKK